MAPEYCLLFVLGVCYHDIKTAVDQKRTRRYFLYLAAVGMAAICVFYMAGQPLDMQSNKFPPNMVFLVYSVMMMALIFYALPSLDRLIEKTETSKLFGSVFNLFSTRSMTIFLYQVFPFIITIRLADMLVRGDGFIASIAKSVLCLATTIPACAGVAVIFGKIERLEIRHYGNKV